MPFRTAPVFTRSSYLALQPCDSAGPLLSSALMDGLTSRGADGAVVPGLAFEWYSTDAAREWVFLLREGVSAPDLARQLTLLTVSPSPYASSVRSLETSALVTGWDALSQGALRVRCARPAPQMPLIASTAMFKVPLTSSPSGSSPFRLLASTATRSTRRAVLRFVARATPPAVSAPRLAQARQLRVTFAASADERVERVLAGADDIALGVQGLAPALLARARAAGLTVLRHRTEWLPVVVPRRGGWPATDPQVLDALRGALDREALCRDVYAGYAVPGADHPFVGVPPPPPRCAEPAPGPSPSFGRAIALRWSHPQHERLAEALVAQWRRATAFTFTVARASPYAPASGGLDLLAFDSVFSLAGLLILHLDPRWSPAGWGPGAPGLRLIDQAHLAVSAEQRAPLLRLAVRLLSCHGPYLVPVVPERLDVADPAVVEGLASPGVAAPLSADQLVVALRSVLS